MVEPLTKTIFDVSPKKVDARTAAGWVLLEEMPEAEPEPEEVAEVVRPDDSWTISELRALAGERGIEVRKKATKAELLGVLDGVCDS